MKVNIWVVVGVAVLALFVGWKFGDKIIAMVKPPATPAA